MKFQLFKRLVTEDFDSKDQELVGKLASIINTIVDQLNRGLHKNIDFDNLNQEVVSFSVTVNSSGIPTTALQLSSNLKSVVRGVVCINAINETDSTILTSAPFISFTRSSGVISINQITGLPANKKYSITAILIG